MITFEPLWRTLDEKGVTQYKLFTQYGISRGQINRMKHNKMVTTKIINTLCTILDCEITNIIEYKKDPEK